MWEGRIRTQHRAYRPRSKMGKGPFVHQSKPDMWTKVQGWKRDRPIVRGGQGMNAPWECLSCPPAPKRQGTIEDIRDVQVKKKGNIWGR